MEKSIFYIELMNGPGRGNNKTKNGSDGARFNYWRESFVVIDTVLLREPTINPTRFIPRESAIRMKFLTEHPLSRNNICIRRLGNKLPCVIGLECLKLIAHGSGPVRIKKSG